MAGKVHRLQIKLIFPDGIAPGEGGDFNTLPIARDGQQRPLLRGTSLAGAIRHSWARHFGKGDDQLEDLIFGHARDNEVPVESNFKVSNLSLIHI